MLLLGIRKKLKNMQNSLIGQKLGFVSVVAFVGVIKNQSSYKCECLNCGSGFVTTLYYLTHKRSDRCNHCKDRRFTSFEESVIAFRFHWFGHSAVELAKWYGVSRQTIYAAIRRVS